MPVIKVAVVGKEAAAERGKTIVCNNTDYVIEFEFSEEWNAYDYKTARFWFSGQYQDVLFKGTTCNAPPILCSNIVKIGVFAGDLITSIPAIVQCEKSILCEGGYIPDPQPDVYEQIMKELNEIKMSGEADLPIIGVEDNGKVLTAEGGKWIAKELPTYRDSYEVTPAVDEQIVPTAQKYMENNLTVKAIPYYDVSNPSGGNTIFIGSEVN